jgi:hypothetical protein
LAAEAIPFFLTKKGEKVKEKRNAPPVFPGYPHIAVLKHHGLFENYRIVVCLIIIHAVLNFDAHD